MRIVLPTMATIMIAGGKVEMATRRYGGQLLSNSLGTNRYCGTLNELRYDRTFDEMSQVSRPLARLRYYFQTNTNGSDLPGTGTFCSR